MIRTNLSERLREGRQLARSAHVAEDVNKMGTLRAGNSGIMSPQGEIAGSCHRLAHLRSLGIQLDEPDDSKLIMFQLGTANEDVIYRDLLHTCTENEVVLRETEIPTRWLTKNGTPVTGRPDAVVCIREGVDATTGAPITKPLFGIEIKSVASVWTSRDVLGEQKPKTENLIQAAHYAWQIGVPFRLMYKMYAIQEIPGWSQGKDKPGWTQKLFPKEGEPGSEYIDYKKGRIQPYEIVYEIRLSQGSEGFVEYRKEPPTSAGSSDEGWTRTLIQTEDIRQYYEFVSQMAEKKELGPRPMNIGPDGKKKSWSKCDPQYCSLTEVCDKKEKLGYDAWLKEVKNRIT